MGSLETYASQALYGGIELTIENSQGQNKSTYVSVKGIDYRKFKLFLLSITFLILAALCGIALYFFPLVSFLSELNYFKLYVYEFKNMSPGSDVEFGGIQMEV